MKTFKTKEILQGLYQFPIRFSESAASSFIVVKFKVIL